MGEDVELVELIKLLIMSRCSISDTHASGRATLDYSLIVHAQYFFFTGLAIGRSPVLNF